jgi:hypothetical protein
VVKAARSFANRNGKALLRKRGEKIKRSFAHTFNSSGPPFVLRHWFYLIAGIFAPCGAANFWDESPLSSKPPINLVIF